MPGCWDDLSVFPSRLTASPGDWGSIFVQETKQLMRFKWRLMNYDALGYSLDKGMDEDGFLSHLHALAFSLGALE